MYTACLFCSQRLGHNRSVRSFPVGTRLAFEARSGRLWVVCPHCDRWNLTALEERWEAIEECERLFRRTRLRVAGANIGLAQLPDGCELIRIGPAIPNEVAAWRYGRRLTAGGSRDDDAVVVASRVTRLGDVVRSALTWLPRRGSAGAGLWLRLRAQPHRVVDAVAGTSEDRALICYRHVESAELLRPEAGQPLRLAVRLEQGSLELTGRAALGTVGKLLAVINGRGAANDEVRAALRKLDNAGDPQSYFSRVATLALRTAWGREPEALARTLLPGNAGPAERLACLLACRSFWARGGTGSAPRTPLVLLSPVDRLALEMAAHEESERRALEGELAELEAAWRQAEEVAAIADQLFLRPTPVEPRESWPRWRLLWAAQGTASWIG